ncbi:MAG: hypothetical protein VKI81_10055 [Synechococcaceae cyanobacterium]|nr:hypothetical protein [Synechococcaceae cyanobacterium]
MKLSPLRPRDLPSLLAAALLPLGLATAAVAASRVRPYPEAVLTSRTAARAVLDRAGGENCLRGKLTRALLGLSASCEKAGERTDLCRLADEAVVVTPMTLSFMDRTARRLLELSAPERQGP